MEEENKDWCVGVSLLCSPGRSQIIAAVPPHMQEATLPETTTAGGRQVLLVGATAMPSPLHITSLSHDQSDPPCRQIVVVFAKQGAVGTRGKPFLSFFLSLSCSRDLKVCWFVGATLDALCFAADKQPPAIPS